MEDIKTLVYTLAAAACGAYVSSVINPKPLSLTRRVVGGTCGIMIAYWWAVPFAEHFGVVEPRAMAAVVFGFALFWEKAIAVASDLFENFVKRLFNKQGA